MTAFNRFYRWFAGHERATVWLIAVMTAGVSGFLWLAEEVHEGKPLPIDQTFLVMLRAPGTVDASPRLAETVRDVTALGSVTGLGIFTAVALGHFWLTQRRALALFVAASCLTGTLACAAVKKGVDRPRPESAALAAEEPSHSFPSGHATLSAGILLTLAAALADAQRSRIRSVYLLAIAGTLSAVIGVSRVSLGVHWPTDVLAGWAFGIAWAAGGWLAFQSLRRRIEEAPETVPGEVGLGEGLDAGNSRGDCRPLEALKSV